jgi:hypothetical protein
MPCACNANAKGGQSSFVVTKPDGSKQSYKTEIEAKAAAKRTGGTVR